MKLLLVLFFFLVNTAYAAVMESYDFAFSRQQQQFHKLTLELRCLVCQNQSLADSQAPLAADLRRQVAVLVRQDKSNAAIKQYLKQRYGDFVLYRPPVQTNTFVLWFAPLILLLGVLMILWFKLRVRGVSPQTMETDVL